MILTPNYGFIIPAGSDAVNLLTQCYPNFSSLDTILKPIQESGVTVATDTKVGTVHQLVRTDSSCNMFRFIATGNYASGDTFTVDGASVTATAMNGTALSAGAFVINQSVVCILNNLVLTVLVSGKETTSLPASAVTYDNSGSGLTATNAQDAIDEVYNAIPVIPPVTEHGLYEMWTNPNPLLQYAPATISFAFDATKYDALEIEWAFSASESLGIVVKRYEKVAFTSGTPLIASEHQIFMDSNKLFDANRAVTITYSSGTVSIDFAGAYGSKYDTYGSAPTTTANNAYIIPLRVLALAHNS